MQDVDVCSFYVRSVIFMSSLNTFHWIKINSNMIIWSQ